MVFDSDDNLSYLYFFLVSIIGRIGNMEYLDSRSGNGWRVDSLRIGWKTFRHLMDIDNVTQFYHLLARTGLVDQIPRGRHLMACVDEYAYQCNCEKDKNRTAIYNRCKAIYEEIIGGLNHVTITLFFQKVPDLSITFKQDVHRHLRTITR